MTEGRQKRQQALTAAYGRLYKEVSRLLREADPIRLITIGAPDDEYDPEVRTILTRLREAQLVEDVQKIIYEEFVHWFDADIADRSLTMLRWQRKFGECGASSRRVANFALHRIAAMLRFGTKLK